PSNRTPRQPVLQFSRSKYSYHRSKKNRAFWTTIFLMPVISFARKPLASATPTGSSQNFAYRSAWATWICGGSRPSILKKKNRYPLTLSRLGTSQVYRVASPVSQTLRAHRRHESESKCHIARPP